MRAVIYYYCLSLLSATFTRRLYRSFVRCFPIYFLSSQVLAAIGFMGLRKRGKYYIYTGIRALMVRYQMLYIQYLESFCSVLSVP